MARHVVSVWSRWTLAVLVFVTGCSSGRLFVNGDILTMDPARPWADAVAVRDGRIVAVGTRTEVERTAKGRFEIEDLHGNTMLPGFIDAHGHLLRTGMELVGSDPDQPSSEPTGSRAAIEAAVAHYASHGITTGQEAGIGSLDVVRAYGELGKGDRLAIDVVGFPAYTVADRALADFAVDRQYRDRFRLGGVQLVLDGSLEGYTGYLTEPYYVQPSIADAAEESTGADVDHAGGGVPGPEDRADPEGRADPEDRADPEGRADYRGHSWFESQEQLDESVGRAYANGWPLIAHTSGDAATDMLLAAVRAAAEAFPGEDRRTVIVDARAMRDDQLDDARELGVIPSFFASDVYYGGDRDRDVLLGPERAARLSPLRSALERGLPFTIHHDSPAAPADMLELVWTASTRVTSSGETLGPDQRVPVLAALRSVTINAARQIFEEDAKGSIEPGKLADLVVLSANPVELDPMSIKDIVVVETIKEGETVYRRY